MSERNATASWAVCVRGDCCELQGLNKEAKSERTHLERHLNLSVECAEHSSLDFFAWSAKYLRDLGGCEDRVGACGVVLEVLCVECV